MKNKVKAFFSCSLSVFQDCFQCSTFSFLRSRLSSGFRNHLSWVLWLNILLRSFRFMLCWECGHLTNERCYGTICFVNYLNGLKASKSGFGSGELQSRKSARDSVTRLCGFKQKPLFMFVIYLLMLKCHSWRLHALFWVKSTMPSVTGRRSELIILKSFVTFYSIFFSFSSNRGEFIASKDHQTVFREQFVILIYAKSLQMLSRPNWQQEASEKWKIEYWWRRGVWALQY